MKKDFINIEDFTAKELKKLIELIGVVKEAKKKRTLPNLLNKASIAMIFEESSTRTRTSFEVAMTLLGGHGIYIRPGDIHLGKSESLYDTAQILSRMVDGIVIRSKRYQEIEDFAKYSSVPVINAMSSDTNHPTQVLCDMFTIFEKAKKVEGVNLAFIGDSRKGSAANVCRDLMLISSMLGVNFYLASPKGYQVDEEFLEKVLGNSERSGARVIVTDNPIKAVSEADFIYTDEFVWYDMAKKEQDERKRIFKPKYQVNSVLMKCAPAHAKFMHCLPAKRGEEVTDEVMDSPQSIIFEQGENRLHTQVALLIAFIASRLKECQVNEENYYKKKIYSALDNLHGFK